MAFPDAKRGPSCPPSRYVSGLEVFVERDSIDPEFTYMDEARIKHVLGI